MPTFVLRLIAPRPNFAQSLTDAEVHSKLINLGLDYIKDHPASLLEAFYWNGLSRLWDIRRPSNALAEVPFEGRKTANWAFPCPR